MLEREIIPFFREYQQKPESGNVALMRSKLSRCIPERDMEQYTEAVALDAFNAGFKAACNIILPAEAEKGRNADD